MALARGDVIVCAFQAGRRDGNPISLSPDGKIVVLERRSAVVVEPRQPYVCRVKAIGPLGVDGEPRSYVAHVERRVGPGDYCDVIDADFIRGTLTVRLVHPTRFASVRRARVQAEWHEEYLAGASGHEEALVVTLRYGTLERPLEFSRKAALRAGLRFSHFIRVSPPKRALAHVPLHPGARRAEAGWQPNPMDTVGFLLEPTSELLLALPRVTETVAPADLLDTAHRRVAEILMGTYEPIGLESPDHLALERVLTALARLALAPGIAVGSAERNLALTRCASLSSEAMAGVLAEHVGPFEIGEGTLAFLLPDFVPKTAGRRDASWALCNRDVRGGRVYLAKEDAEQLLGDLVYARALMPSECPAPLAGLVRELRAGIPESAARLPILRGPRGVDLDAIPPCVAHTLKAALKRPLAAGELQLVRSFLGVAGLSEGKIRQTIHGGPPPAAGRPPRPGQVPTCAVIQRAGLCGWDCDVRTPVEYHTKNRQGVTVVG